MYDLLRPLLFKLDPEAAHRLTLYGLGVAQRSHFAHWLAPPPGDLPTTAFGISFPNPVGLAAGLDKNAEHLQALDALGFGFIEVGTVTPLPQPGNDKPRMFRLAEHEAVINRLGFNNGGVDALVRNVQRAGYRGVLGINIGKNKDTPNEKAVNDYLTCLHKVYAHASYITVNISSPNTQGLRDLQQEATLYKFISLLRAAQERLGAQAGSRKPMLLKIAPDLTEAELDAIADVLLRTGIDGVICGNTTIDHAAVADHPHGAEAGGLSGKPLFAKSTAVLAGMSRRLQGRIPLIGVGGILDGSDAAEKIDAGAALVQIYSGLIYRGPALVAECVNEIRRQRQAASDRNSHAG
jgi:dihydroorotate dehydrogenase